MIIQNEERVVSFVERFQSVVASDGFEGFFHADASDDAQATLNALPIVKAIDAAALLRRAMLVFESGAPPREQHARREALLQIGETERAHLRRLDKRFRSRRDELTGRSLATHSRVKSAIASLKKNTGGCRPAKTSQRSEDKIRPVG